MYPSSSRPQINTIPVYLLGVEGSVSLLPTPSLCPYINKYKQHSYIANGLGGADGLVVIDLNKHFTNIQSTPSSNRATIQSGSRLGDIALALNEQGQGLGHGTCPYVGIGGHASFGGFGFASRSWGIVLDVIEEMELVLSNGTITTASKSQNLELFWVSTCHL
jgi:FAD/FMN-containing dehydrogenase